MFVLLSMSRTCSGRFSVTVHNFRRAIKPDASSGTAIRNSNTRKYDGWQPIQRSKAMRCLI